MKTISNYLKRKRINKSVKLRHESKLDKLKGHKCLSI